MRLSALLFLYLTALSVGFMSARDKDKGTSISTLEHSPNGKTILSQIGGFCVPAGRNGNWICTITATPSQDVRVLRNLPHAANVSTLPLHDYDATNMLPASGRGREDKAIFVE